MSNNSSSIEHETILFGQRSKPMIATPTIPYRDGALRNNNDAGDGHDRRVESP